MTKSPLSVYDQALKYLNLKMHSEGDLAWKLTNKGYTAEEVSQIIVELKEEGLINDEHYAEVYVQNLINYRSFGYFGIRQKLLQKRLPRSLVDQVLRANLDESREEVIARRTATKLKQQGRDKNSIIRSLRQKGFRTEVIFAVLNSV